MKRLILFLIALCSPLLAAIAGPTIVYVSESGENASRSGRWMKRRAN
jgi:integral membrane sensor domain MASE1